MKSRAGHQDFDAIIEGGGDIEMPGLMIGENLAVSEKASTRAWQTKIFPSHTRLARWGWPTAGRVKRKMVFPG